MKLKAWRESEGITQKEAAERFGCSEGHVASMENGRRIPRPKLLRVIQRETRKLVRWADFDPIEEEAAAS